MSLQSPTPAEEMAARQGGAQLIRTCQHCVVAKVRCIRQPRAVSCDRCLRLDKDCVYRKARRRPHGAQRDPRIEALEAKIDQLLSVQQSENSDLLPSTEAPPRSTSSPGDSRKAPFEGARVNPQPSGEQSHLGMPGGDPAQSQQSSASSPSTGSGHGNVLDGGFFSSDEANALLNYFRLAMSPHFPFVIIPPSMTAEDLGTERPFLLLTVLAAASHENMPLQKHVCNEVRSAISDRVIIGGDISLEMLQGILVYLAWSHYHPRPRQYPQLVHLAMSLVSEWALDLPAKSDSWKTKVNWHREVEQPMETEYIVKTTTARQPATMGWETGHGSSGTRNRTRTTEDYRAMLGCYYLTSSVAVLLGKRNAFPCSTFVEDVARHFAENPEYSSDKYLSCCIQLQSLIEKIDNPAMDGNARNDRSSLLGAWAMRLKVELDMLKEKFPSANPDCFPLMVQLHSTELFLYQIALPDKQYPESWGPASWADWRVELLSAGLISATQMFQRFLAQPFNAEKAYSNTEWIHLACALLITSKLTVASAAQPIARQTQHLRRMLAYGTVLQQISARLGAMVSPAVDARGDRDTFHHFQRRVQMVEEWYSANFGKATQLADDADATAAAGVANPASLAATSLLVDAYGPRGTSIPFQSDAPNIVVSDELQTGELSIDELPMDINFSYYFPDSIAEEIMGNWTTDPVAYNS